MSFVCAACGASRDRPDRCPVHGTYLIDALSLAQSPNDTTLGSLLAGKYALVGILGRGGFGHVYRAWHEVLDREVAVKLIRRSKATGVEFRERFFLEARAVARLRGPSIVTLHDFGEESDGRLYMVLELVNGPNLRQAIPNGTRLEPARALRLTLPVLRALSEAHGQGIVHRDIKPSNLMLTVDDEGHETIKVLDFGVAKFVEESTTGISDRSVTKTGQVVGTPRYVSPEQAAGTAVGPAADQYSVGVILYELLAGRPPFQGVDLVETVSLRVQTPAPDLPADVNASVELRAALARSLERVPGQRFESAQAFATALRSTSELRAVAEDEAPPQFAAAPTAMIELHGDVSGNPVSETSGNGHAVPGPSEHTDDSLLAATRPANGRRALVIIVLLLAAVSGLLLMSSPGPEVSGTSGTAAGRPQSLAPPATTSAPAPILVTAPPTAAPSLAPEPRAPATSAAPPSRAPAVPSRRPNPRPAKAPASAIPYL